MRLIIPPDDPADDPARSLRERMEGGSREGRFYISRPCGLKPRAFTQEFKVPGMSPPLPELFPDAPDNEVVDSMSELPSARSPAEETFESSEEQTRKRTRSSSEASDALTLPTPRNPSCLERHSGGHGGSSSPIPDVPVRAVAPQPPAKRKKEEKKGRRAPPVFDLSDFDSDSAREMVGESKVAPPLPQTVATSEGAALNPSPQEVRVGVPQKTTGGPSESPSDHPFFQGANQLVKQHLALEASLQQLQEENNTALRNLDALKKSLRQAEKKAEDAVGDKERLEQELADTTSAKERLQKEATDREEQLATAAASCEKEVAGKLMAAAKAISDVTGIEFNRGALENGSALDDATAAVKDGCSNVIGSLAKAKVVLGRFYKELVPKGVALEDVELLADALSAEDPAAYKRKQKAIGASMGLAMDMASGAELDLHQVTSQMSIAADGSEVAFALYAACCKRYGPKLIDLLAEYAVRQQGEAKSRQSGSEAT